MKNLSTQNGIRIVLKHTKTTTTNKWTKYFSHGIDLKRCYTVECVGVEIDKFFASYSPSVWNVCFCLEFFFFLLLAWASHWTNCTWANSDICNIGGVAIGSNQHVSSAERYLFVFYFESKLNLAIVSVLKKKKHFTASRQWTCQNSLLIDPVELSFNSCVWMKIWMEQNHVSILVICGPFNHLSNGQFERQQQQIGTEDKTQENWFQQTRAAHIHS